MIFNNAICIAMKGKEEEARKEFEKYSIDVRFVEAIDGSNIDVNEHGLIGGYQALNQVLINEIDKAVEENQEGLLVFESDVVFTENPVDAIENSTLPPNVDVFYLGARASYATPKTKDDRIKRVFCAVLGHAVYVKKTIFSIWREELAKMEKPSDLCLVDAYSKMEENDYKYKAYYFKPGIAYQRAGYSDNLKRNCKERWVD